MTDTAIAADVHQTFDVELNQRTAFALDLNAQFGNFRTNGAHLLVVPVLNLHIVADTCLVENFTGGRTAYTVDIGQADLTAFVFW